MKKLIFFIVLLLFVNVVFAKDITISLNQSEYYFLVNQQAVITLNADNSYGKNIDGVLTYTITQQIMQQGFQYSSSNTNSQSFTIEDGKKTVDLGFGTSDQPATLTVKLSFTYTEKEQRVVDLDDIKIHFVQDESQKQNQENKQESKSESVQQQNQQQNQQQQNNLQQQMQNMFQQPQQQTAQDMVQNNQMDQDASALKQQMQKQMEEQKKMNEEFEKNLVNNEEFQKAHQEMLDQGYNFSSGNIDPLNSTSGDFELNYEKDGETAKLNGKMENNEITEMEKSSSEDVKNIMDKLSKDERFQSFDSELNKSGFNQLEVEVSKDGNITQVKIPYIDEKNGTAEITAKIEDDQIEEVKLERNRSYFWIWAIVVLALVLVLSYIYKKYFKKKEEVGAERAVERPIDFRKEALKILEGAKKLFDEGDQKDAYGKAAEAIRFYYSYKIGSKTEITNSELIRLLKGKKINFEETLKCLNLCGLVEFAKYNSNKEDFDEIIELGKQIIR
ncbi:MAG: hypothetical protein ABIJ08_05830 [Nanoarchaeota archaeon]